MTVDPTLIYRNFIVLLMSTILVNGFGQDYYHQFTKADGLPSNECYDTYQDKNGLIWIATDRGLASFDGNSFTTYGTDEGLPNAVVLELFPQEDGTIWCTTISNDLFYFYPDELVFHPYKYNHVIKKIGGYQPIELVIGKEGNLLYRLMGGVAFCRINADGSYQIVDHGIKVNEDAINVLYWTKEKYPYLRLEGISDTYEGTPVGSDFVIGITRISTLKTHTLLAPINKLILLNDQNEIIMTRELGHLKKVNNSGSTDEFFWIGFSNGGVECLDSSGKLIHHYAPNHTVTKYYKDKLGGIWITTQSSGVLYYPPVKISLIRSTENLKIQHLSVGSKGELLFADNVGHLYHIISDTIVQKNYQGNVPCAQTYRAPWGFYSNEKYITINSLITNKTVDMRIKRFSDARNKKPLMVTTFQVVNQNGEFVYSQTIHTKNRAPLSDAEYLRDQVLVAKSDSLIKKGEHEGRSVAKSLGIKINEFDVHNNLIICGTAGKGVYILNEQLEVLNVLSTSDGLKSNFINEVLVQDGVLWIATHKGLAKVNNPFKKPKIEVITNNHGLFSDEVLDIEILGDTMYLGTSSGLYHFNVKDWFEIVGHKSKIVFNKGKLLVKGNEVSSLLNLQYSDHPIEVHFQLYSYEQRSGVSFRYKLVGLNDSWKETTDRKVIFQSLPPGEYELIIQPMFDGVPRDETIRQKIVIKEAFFNTWWFIALVILVIIAGTWAFVRYRVIAYNRELIREILRFTMKRLKPKTKSFVVRCDGKNVLINSEDVLFVESNGNYINIHTTNRKLVVREKISNFDQMVPDKLEYVRVHRSVIVRKDKITGRSTDFIIIDSNEIKIGNTYRKNIENLEL